MKYVKKPIIVEAFQLGVDEEPDWFINHDKKGKVRRRFEYGNARDSNHYKETIEIWNSIGISDAFNEDFIIKGNDGEIYPCKKDVFKQTYTPWEDDIKQENEDEDE